jgi:glycerate dehydrogenase
MDRPSPAILRESHWIRRKDAMKLVILDGYAVNPDDLDWSPLLSLADCAIYDRTPEAEVPARAANAEIILTNKTPLRASTLAHLPSLKYIGVLASGYDVVDIEAAAARNIAVTNVPEYSTRSVAQLVFALLLELSNHVDVHAEAVRQGEWTRSPDWCIRKAPLIELAGKTMGIVGPGRIGRQVAEIARALEMRILATSTRAPAKVSAEMKWAPLERVLAEADVVSLHCPLTPATHRMVNASRIALMKTSAFLINTARGALIVEQDLADALNTGRLAGAALDVLSTEPPPETNPLLTARNCIITPHIAWATYEARERLIKAAAENLRAWLSGRPQNVVNASI